jgi:hypothetical protein
MERQCFGVRDAVISTNIDMWMSLVRVMSSPRGNLVSQKNQPVSQPTNTLFSLLPMTQRRDWKYHSPAKARTVTKTLQRVRQKLTDLRKHNQNG